MIDEVKEECKGMEIEDLGKERIEGFLSKGEGWKGGKGDIKRSEGNGCLERILRKG